MESTRIIETRNRTPSQLVRDLCPTDRTSAADRVVLMSREPRRPMDGFAIMAIAFFASAFGLFGFIMHAAFTEAPFSWGWAALCVLLGGLCMAVGAYRSLCINAPASKGLSLLIDGEWKSSYVGYWPIQMKFEAAVQSKPIAIRSVNHGKGGPRTKPDQKGETVPFESVAVVLLHVVDRSALLRKGVDTVAEIFFAKSADLERREIGRHAFGYYGERWLEHGTFIPDGSWQQHVAENLTHECEELPVKPVSYKLESLEAPEDRVRALKTLKEKRSQLDDIVASASLATAANAEARIRSMGLPPEYISAGQERLKRHLSSLARKEIEGKVSSGLSEDQLSALSEELRKSAYILEDDAKEVESALSRADQERKARESREAEERIMALHKALEKAIAEATPETSGGVRHDVRESGLPERVIVQYEEKLNKQLASVAYQRYVERARADSLTTEQIASIRKDMAKDANLHEEGAHKVGAILEEIESAITLRESAQKERQLRAARAEIESAIAGSNPGRSILAEQRIKSSELSGEEKERYSTQLREHLSACAKDSFLERANAPSLSAGSIASLRDELGSSMLSKPDRDQVSALLDEAEVRLMEEDDRAAKAEAAERAASIGASTRLVEALMDAGGQELAAAQNLRAKDPGRFDTAVALLKIGANGK